MKREKFDPHFVKEECEKYVKKKGGLAFGIANLESLEQIAPQQVSSATLFLIEETFKHMSSKFGFQCRK